MLSAGSILRPLAVLALVVVVVRAAWLSDDCYITLRTIDNFWHGFGLRWNVIERVQAYTHPLWMLLLLGAYGVTREAYFTTLAVSAACLVGLVWLVQTKLGPLRGSLAVLAMAVSRAFVDYSSSGLENPLSHVLLAAFCIACLRSEEPQPGDEGAAARFRWLAWLAMLCSMTRLDLGLLVLPPMLLEARRRGLRRAIPDAAIAMLPLVAWHAFTLIYYGSLMPNTALAKLATGIGFLDRVRQGVFYLAESLRADFITLPTIAAAIGATVFAATFFPLTSERVRPLAVGLVLSLLYVIWIGGDFMSGRFLTAPFVVALMMVVHLPTRPSAVWGTALVIVLLGSVSPRSPLRVWIPEDSEPWSVIITDPTTHGIVDERRVYYWATGFLRNVRHQARVMDHPWAQSGMILSGRAQVQVRGAIGLVGYYAGPQVHIIDPLALTDPFLSRRPIAPDRAWSAGHFVRDLPSGYRDSVADCVGRLAATGTFPSPAMSCVDFGRLTNHLESSQARAQYADVLLLSQAPLFSPSRWLAIARLHGLPVTGAREDGLSTTDAMTARPRT